jgi:hypothetical protein
MLEGQTLDSSKSVLGDLRAPEADRPPTDNAGVLLMGVDHARERPEWERAEVEEGNN